MTVMQQLNRIAILAAASLFAAGAVLIAQSDPKPKTEPKRPQISMKATPASGMVPVRVVGMVELKGGDDDFEEYYCPTIEWNWDERLRALRTRQERDQAQIHRNPPLPAGGPLPNYVQAETEVEGRWRSQRGGAAAGRRTVLDGKH
jgi:hypothetical protein